MHESKRIQLRKARKREKENADRGSTKAEKCSTRLGEIAKMDEIWKPVPRWSERYYVSNTGRIFSLRLGRLISPWTSKAGYLCCRLQSGRKVETWRVHRLVYLTHIGPIPTGLDVAHLNGVSTDNNALNLVAATRSENCGHKVVHGTDQSGERSTCHKLTWKKVDEVRSRYMAGEFMSSIGNSMGVHKATIRNVIRFITWKPERR